MSNVVSGNTNGTIRVGCSGDVIIDMVKLIVFLVSTCPHFLIQFSIIAMVVSASRGWLVGLWPVLYIHSMVFRCAVYTQNIHM